MPNELIVDKIARAIEPLLQQTDDAATIAAAVLEVLRPMIWQPIESAPKDNKEHILIAGRMGDDCPWRISTAMWFFDDWASIEPGFGDPFPWQPTHFMPLPDPSTLQTGER